MRFRVAALACALGLVVGMPAEAAKPGRGTGVSFPISCSPAAQENFNDALAALHSFWFAQAAKEFAAIADSEPDCAMAHWGFAMSRWTQLWAPPRQDNLDAGLAAIRKAIASGTKTERELDYIGAAAAFYTDNDKLDHRARVVAYAAQMENLFKKYPQDQEAASFYALSLLAIADPLDGTYAKQRQAGQVLEAIFKQLPDHPAAAHYLIHAYDCGPLAELARPAAERYAKSAAVVPHAIHMPSHTYVLLGLWRENIASNLLGEKAEVDRGIPEDRLHNIDYLVYGYLQVGDEAKAKEFRDLGLSIERELMAAKRDVGLRSRPFAVAAIEARYALERSDWAEAAALEPRPNRFAYIEAVPHFARAIGAARSGKPDQAKADLDKLASLQDALVKAKLPYWARVVDIQHKVASAWTADAQGKASEAMMLMQAAVQLEKTTDTHDTLSPGPIGSTAHEALGELQLKHAKAVEALASFEESLGLAKNRARSYYGAAKAASASGQAERARSHVARLAEVCGTGSASVRADLDLTTPLLSTLPCVWLTR